MGLLTKKSRLEKSLGLLDVYAIATGATLSSGFFLLPGLAAMQAGHAVALAYLLAVLPLLPAVISKVELSTAMPRAGGAYYFLDRSMGPLAGTIGGLGTWVALILKTSFALVGIGAYASLVFPGLPPLPIAMAAAVAFGLLGLMGARKAARMQLIMVAGLLLILGWLVGVGLGRIDADLLRRAFDTDLRTLVSTAGFVYVSYVGVTKIASVAEEIENPERNLPLGVFLSVATVVVIFALGTEVMVAVIPMETLRGDLTPAATAAEALGGLWGMRVVTLAAVLAFFSVANAGIMSASRYPLAMSRDHLVPRVFRRLTRRRTPGVAIVTTVGVILLCLLLFDVTKIAKLASTFQLLLFGGLCLAVIVMRESRLDSYDPGYRSPLYPWTQLFGIAASLFFLFEMGALAHAFSAGLILLGLLWYRFYARARVQRGSALDHVFARLGQRSSVDLDRELRGILKEKGLRTDDPFDRIVVQAEVLDLASRLPFETVARMAAKHLAERTGADAEAMSREFLEGTLLGITPVDYGAALPHLRLGGIERPELVLVRAHEGVEVDLGERAWAGGHGDQPIRALFFLVSPEDDPAQHLRLLAQIADRVDDEGFMDEWLAAEGPVALRELLLRDGHFVTLSVIAGSPSAAWIGQSVDAIEIPDGALAAILHRQGHGFVPSGDTRLEEGDRLTIIGHPRAIHTFAQRWRPAPGDGSTGPTAAPGTTKGDARDDPTTDP